MGQLVMGLHRCRPPARRAMGTTRWLALKPILHTCRRTYVRCLRLATAVCSQGRRVCAGGGEASCEGQEEEAGRMDWHVREAWQPGSWEVHDICVRHMDGARDREGEAAEPWCH